MESSFTADAISHHVRAQQSTALILRIPKRKNVPGMLWLPASACPCDHWKDNRASVGLSGLDLKDRRQRFALLCPAAVCDQK
jgi:hypothetical protein